MQEEKRTEREKIEAFVRFENNLTTQKNTQKNNSEYTSYHKPFKEIIQAFMNKNPAFAQKFQNEVGDIYFEIRSLTYGKTSKVIAYPIMKDDKVNAFLIGVINPQRDWVNFTVAKDDTPEVQRIISKFQNYYNSASITSRSREKEQAIEEIVIVVDSPGQGPITFPYVDHNGFGSGMSGGGPSYGGTGSGGGGGQAPPARNPCKEAESSMSDANTILKSGEVQKKMDLALKGKIQASNEWTVAIGEKPNGDFEVTEAVEQNADKGTIPSSQLKNTYIGDGHSHSGSRGNPSGGDLYSMITSLNDSPNLKYRFVYGNSSEGTAEVYALVISDASLAKEFLKQFSKDQNYDTQSRSFKDESLLGTEFYKAKKYYSSGTFTDTSDEDYDSRAVAMAYILDKYNAGISIAKADANGNLKRINAEISEITIPYSGGKVKEGVKISKCP
ncbi:hypothetical protein [Chryseobacterium sp. StRB126]|uniref:hypothetical protein n=1 Tax=Chryseobacterium sp. StRB126 TaxID=878220 RepID=UPI0005EE43A8|nr:hypothetical protein [Chryseobacterium sp. StRB126]